MLFRAFGSYDGGNTLQSRNQVKICVLLGQNTTSTMLVLNYYAIHGITTG